VYVDRKTDYLIELGRKQGRLTTEDIQKTLPIAELPMEEVADLILKLERAGIEVELDPMLLAPTTGSPMVPSAAGDVTLGTPRPEAPRPHPMSSIPELAPVHVASKAPVEPRRTGLYASAAVLIVLGALMFFFLMLYL
jgi:hypothetical protein